MKAADLNALTLLVQEVRSHKKEYQRLDAKCRRVAGGWPNSNRHPSIVELNKSCKDLTKAEVSLEKLLSKVTNPRYKGESA